MGGRAQPARGGEGEGETGLTHPPQGFSTPTSVERLSVEELCISLEDYLGEEVSEEVPRETLVRALKLAAGLEH